MAPDAKTDKTPASSEESGCYTEHGVSGYGVAAKLSHAEAMEEGFIKPLAEKMMLAIAQKCIDAGAKCIGHIKSHLRTDAGTIKADTIGVTHGSYSTGSLKHPVNDIFIAVNSIVQGIPEDTVKTATLDGIHEVAQEAGLSVVKEKEHTYFDEFDFVTSKQDYVKQLQEQLVQEQLGEDEPAEDS